MALNLGTGFGSGLSKTATGISRNIVGQGQAGELFNPMGSPRLRALRRRRALQLRDAARQRGQGAAQLYGLDPMQRRQAMIDSDIAQGAAVTGDLLGADFEEAQSGRDFARGLLGGQLDFERQRALEKERRKTAAAGGMGSAVGTLGGALIGKLPGL